MANGLNKPLRLAGVEAAARALGVSPNTVIAMVAAKMLPVRLRPDGYSVPVCDGVEVVRADDGGE